MPRCKPEPQIDMEDGILVPISSRHTVQDGVYQQLRTALMAGQYDPGQRLTIALLATAFGVSHMPVREALRKLVAENALEQGANGSVSVPNVRQDRLDDICRARVALEGLAAELAAPLITSGGIRMLDKLRISHKDAGIEHGAYESLARNQEFHFFIYRASGSEVLPQLIEALWLRFGPYMRMLSHHLVQSVGPEGFRNGAEFHANAIKALERRDAQALRFCIEADIRATHAMLRPLVPTADGPLDVTRESVAG